MAKQTFAQGLEGVLSKVRGTCDNCGKKVGRLHLPINAFGWFCEECCPICDGAANAAGGRAIAAVSITAAAATLQS